MSPFLPQTLGLTNAIEALQSILHPPTDNSMQHQRVLEEGITQEQRAQTPTIQRIPVPINKRATRSTPTALYPLGTIICRKFEIDNIFHKGEVMMYDPTNNLYHIKYRDGDIDDFNYEEVTKYRKVKQKYPKVLKLKQINHPLTHFDHKHDIFFIPTKANPNPIQPDYNKQHLAFLMKEQHRDYCEDKHYALLAGGRVWDEYLQKMASYTQLIKHTDTKISKRWLTGGENDFG